MKRKPPVLIERERILKRISELGEEITEDYQGRDLIMVGILKGAFVVLADLARFVDLPAQIDFIAVSSYGADTRSSGVVSIVKDLDLDIQGKHVLLVEDIVDTGLTLDYLVRSMRARQPASLEVFTLLNKVEARKVEVPVKYCGFDIPRVFVVGYGLDYAEHWRQLPYVGILEEDLIDR